MMTDLDLFLPDRDEQAVALTILADLGYHLAPGENDEKWRESHQYAGRVHDDHRAMVEVHRHVVEKRFSPLLPDAAAREAMIQRDWEGLTVAVLDPRHRLLQSMIQASVMARPHLHTGRAPLFKALDAVQLIAAHFKGRFPEDLVPSLSHGAWGGTASSLLTLTDTLFGLPTPLPRNRRALTRLEQVTVFPRLCFLRQTIGRFFSRRFIARLGHPSTLPALTRRYLDTLRTGRDDSKG